MRKYAEDFLVEPRPKRTGRIFGSGRGPPKLKAALPPRRRSSQICLSQGYAPASRSFRGSLPHPTHQLCTLRVRRCRRLTQHSLPGGLLDLTWAGLAPADRASFAWRLPSLDHLIGDGEQLVWNLEAERSGGLEIDGKFELRWLLNGKIGRFGGS
jgi:hypothetical protein